MFHGNSLPSGLRGRSRRPLPPTTLFASCEHLIHVSYISIAIMCFTIAMVYESRNYPPDAPPLDPPFFPFSIMGSIGRDIGDAQLAMIYESLPLLLMALLLSAAVSRFIHQKCTPKALQIYYTGAGIVLLLILHGPQFIFPLFLILVNYFAIAGMHSRLPFWGYMVLMWSFHVAVLVGTRYYGGFTVGFFDDVEYAIWLRTGWARRIRWYILFNMSTLRMIAFNNDIREASFFGAERRERADARHNANCIECALLREAAKSAPLRRVSPSSSSCIASCESEEVPSGTRCYKYRTECPRPIEEYNLRAYLAYTLYIPLFIAGPILSFNAFASYCRHPSQGMSAADLRKYVVRIATLVLCLEFILHYIHINVNRNSLQVLLRKPIYLQAALLYYVLAFLWLKFNIIWKVFRFAALMDGVEPPENMNRCFSNTLTVQDFWRDWHSSFNLWVVRYMYIPMGGNKTRLMNVFPIFLFIGIWHDLELQMLQWALSICVFFVAEQLCVIFFASQYMQWLREIAVYHFLRGLGGALTITGLILANLVGFATAMASPTQSKSQTPTVILKGLASASARFYITVFVGFYCAAQIALRERLGKAERLAALKERFFHPSVSGGSSMCRPLEALPNPMELVGTPRGDRGISMLHVI